MSPRKERLSTQTLEIRKSPRKEIIRSPDFKEFARNTSSVFTSNRKGFSDILERKVTVKEILGVSETLRSADPRLLSSICKDELTKLREIINNLLDYFSFSLLNSQLAKSDDL